MEEEITFLKDKDLTYFLKENDDLFVILKSIKAVYNHEFKQKYGRDMDLTDNIKMMNLLTSNYPVTFHYEIKYILQKKESK